MMLIRTDDRIYAIGKRAPIATVEREKAAAVLATQHRPAVVAALLAGLVYVRKGAQR